MIATLLPETAVNEQDVRPDIDLGPTDIFRHSNVSAQSSNTRNQGCWWGEEGVRWCLLTQVQCEGFVAKPRVVPSPSHSPHTLRQVHKNKKNITTGTHCG